eukprot:gnl/MRDRNA2_/MRDRNA2_35164_c0_seq1.p1 gnl/MRDRNA2_/MRDRNA2_35164_c0~~gnl/MRDRNA2_/MRDRNA2_35164_c0_seq1.p1  ORF type:complete len:360 (-),score=102.74 gnl/MRDRNA2_/MRDRNA2_35164_c0_seq1:7-1086(-)
MNAGLVMCFCCYSPQSLDFFPRTNTKLLKLDGGQMHSVQNRKAFSRLPCSQFLVFSSSLCAAYSLICAAHSSLHILHSTHGDRLRHRLKKFGCGEIANRLAEVERLAVELAAAAKGQNTRAQAARVQLAAVKKAAARAEASANAVGMPTEAIPAEVSVVSKAKAEAAAATAAATQIQEAATIMQAAAAAVEAARAEAEKTASEIIELAEWTAANAVENDQTSAKVQATRQGAALFKFRPFQDNMEKELVEAAIQAGGERIQAAEAKARWAAVCAAQSEAKIVGAAEQIQAAAVSTQGAVVAAEAAAENESTTVQSQPKEPHDFFVQAIPLVVNLCPLIGICATFVMLCLCCRIWSGHQE